MMYTEAEKELNKIISYAEELTGSKKLSVIDILALMARMQCSQTKLIVYLMMEVEKLK
jgi:hypothetical protein